MEARVTSELDDYLQTVRAVVEVSKARPLSWAV